MAIFSLWQNIKKYYSIHNNYCALCHDLSAQNLCNACLSDLSDTLTNANNSCPLCFHYNFHGKICGQCQQKPPHFERLWSSVYYDVPISNMIHRFKHQADLSLASSLTTLMQHHPPNWLNQEQIDWVLPIPLSKERRLHRGFNQSEILTLKLAKKYNWKVLPQNIVYRAEKPPQSTLKSSERHQNIKNIFQIKNTQIQNCNILLIDDVVTTGATLNELARTLKKSGVSKVFCWSLARSRMKR